MKNLSPIFATAHNYSMELPTSEAVMRCLDQAVLKDLQERAQSQNSHYEVYDIFVQDVKNRMQSFLKSHHEAAEVDLDVIQDIFPYPIGFASAATLSFSMTEESMEKLNLWREEIFADLRLSPEARKQGSSWKAVPIIRQP